MPEMPEVQGLVEYLRGRILGLRIVRTSVAQIAALKTFDPQIAALHEASIVSVDRAGKFVEIGCRRPTQEQLHLVFHLAKAGWLRWYEAVPAAPVKPGRSPIAVRVALSDGSGFDLTEAGTKKSLAVYVARDTADVPGISRLGPDPLDPGFTVGTLADLLAGRRTQIKGVLRDQSIVAGIGNAYSDEVLHVARMSPYALAATLAPADVQGLYDAMQATLADALATTSGKPPADLKDVKRRGMRVHGRRGEPCPACGDTVRSVFFADNSLEYCATCQTGGKVLADRRLSRLLK
ncbi:MAG TPA: endonuclease VIII [Microbacterium sp.]|nr:endonuclease VIII [Microbacterium sp.]